jgi:K+-transporting ATPase KdpF subunit
MQVLGWIAVGAAVALAGYLVVALVRAERF